MDFLKGIVKRGEMDSTLKELFVEMSKSNASDLHHS